MLICPSCRKQYKTQTLICTHCGTELLPPSAIALQDRYPELAMHHASGHKTPLKEPYVELLQCSLNEAKQIARLLQPEGITCLIEKNEAFQYDYRIEGGSQIADQKALIVKVKTTEFSKARALLAWEITQELDEETVIGDEANESDPLACPSCKRAVAASDEICPECGLTLDNAELYRCSACGTSCHPKDSTCSACGARFDH